MRWDTTVLLFQVSDVSVVFSRAPYSTRGKEKASWKSPPNEANTGAKESASIPQEKVDYLDGAGIKTGTRSRYRYSWHQCSSCRDASKYFFQLYERKYYAGMHSIHNAGTRQNIYSYLLRKIIPKHLLMTQHQGTVRQQFTRLCRRRRTEKGVLGCIKTGT